MRRRIVFSRHSEADLARLADFLMSASRRRAARAIARIRRGIRNLEDHPELGVAVDDGFRQLILRYGKSSYIVRYRVLPDVILITRIWHGKEDRPR